MQFNGTKYAYIHNLQGDIVGLIDTSGTEVVKYTYDAWGKVLSTTGSLAATLGTVQPFRYRGYVYDVETELYYLRSRYYSPIWKRFINSDKLIENNLFNYCFSCPVSLIDPNGKAPIAEEKVIMYYSPHSKSKVVFTIVNGTECDVLFQVKKENIKTHEETEWYFIIYHTKKNKTHYGYVLSSSVELDETEKRDLDNLPNLINLSYIDMSQTLEFGNDNKTSYQVYCLQCILYNHNFLQSIYQCDGRYGIETRDAVESFQNWYNRHVGDMNNYSLEEDGLVGPHTWNALFDCYQYN